LKPHAEENAFQLRDLHDQVFRFNHVSELFQHVAKVVRVDISGRLWQSIKGEGNIRLARPNLEAEVLRLAQEAEMQAEMQTGFKVGDVVQHEFKSGWVGKVIGFDQSGSFATVRVEWER